MIISNNTIDVSIIDDDPELIMLLNEEFSNNRETNLRWAGADIEHFLQYGIQKTDVLLLDIMLNETMGTDLIKTLKNANPNLYIIMFTIVEDELVLIECIRNGADGYITKGLPFENLVEAIKSTYQGGSNISPFMARKLFNYFNIGSTSKFNTYLNENEFQVLKYLSEGYSYKLIGQKLNMSIDSVRYYIKGVYKKLQVNSKGEAILRFLKES